jgi:uncharacterized FAD-dependent dehydrogenase
MKQPLKYLFIGSGPANLAAASFLHFNNENSFIILEQGKALNQRGCPGIKNKTCISCAGINCPVVEGVGGASANYGNKLCYFPASLGIEKYFAKEHINKGRRFLHALLSPYIDDDYHRTDPQSVDQKHYIADILPKQQYQEMLLKMIIPLVDEGLLRPNSGVNQVSTKKDGLFTVITSTGEEITSENLIFGSGRSAYEFNRNIFDSLGVEYENPQQDIGFRIEAPSNSFAKWFFYQADPKFKFEIKGIGSSRTFCGCNGGMVVPVKFGQGFFADGAFGLKNTNMTNIALMTRVRQPLDIVKLSKWCSQLNEFHGGSLQLCNLHSLSSKEIVKDLRSCIHFCPTEGHRFLIEDLINRLFCETNSVLLPNTEPAEVSILGPAIDRYWPLPKLQQNLETNIPGLFVLGDAAGVSRGIVQALVSGASWAISTNTFSSKIESREKWSVLA